MPLSADTYAGQEMLAGSQVYVQGDPLSGPGRWAAGAAAYGLDKGLKCVQMARQYPASTSPLFSIVDAVMVVYVNSMLVACSETQ